MKTSERLAVAASLRVVASLLIEASKVDDLKLKYPDLADSIDAMAKADPSKTGKYLDWQIKQVLKEEPVEEVISLTESFHKLVQRLEKKDINEYKTLGELRGAIEELGASKSQEKKSLSEEARKDADYLLDDGRFLLVHPKSMKASCHYGRGTKWCVSATESKNYFSYYSKDNINFYFFIDREAKPDSQWSKLAICLKPNNDEFMWLFDSADNKVSYSSAVDFYTDNVVVNTFKEAVAKAERHVSKQPDTWQFKVDNFMRLSEKELKQALSDPNERYLKSRLVQNINLNPGQLKLVLDHLESPQDNMILRDAAYAAENEINIRNIYEVSTQGLHDQLGVASNLVRNDKTPPDILEKIYRDYKGTAPTIVDHRRASGDLIDEILRDRPLLASKVAHNRNTNKETLSYLVDLALSQEPKTLLSAGTVYELASNENVKPGDLTRLYEHFKDSDFDIDSRIARNESTPIETLSKIAKDSRAYVRQSLASNRAIPEEILNILEVDNDTGVRVAVERNREDRKNS